MPTCQEKAGSVRLLIHVSKLEWLTTEGMGVGIKSLGGAAAEESDIAG